MDKFVVSARKYRPTRFDEVVGQESVTLTLKNAIKSGALAHSFLFCGPRGVGKTTCARILAKTINCQNLQPDFEACNECDACRAFNSNASFNVHELDAASNNSVDDIRSLVDQVRFAPQAGKYKVYIIDEVHMLSASAFNAFLKTLEEPPSYAKFILATTEKHKILPTILSRCQIFDFNRITVEGIVNHLKGICAKENITAEEDALHVVAQKADGALRDALSMFDRLVDHTTNTLTFANVIASLNLLDYDYFFQVTDLLMSQDQTGLFLLFDKVVRNGFEGDHFIGGVAEHFRNLMIAKDPKTIGIIEAGGELKQRYRIQAEQIPNSLMLNALNIANQCEITYKTSKNHRLHVELALLKMCYLTTVLKTPTTEGADVKKNSTDDGVTRPASQPTASTYTPTAPAPTPKAAEPVASPLTTPEPKAETPKTEAPKAAEQEAKPSPTVAKPLSGLLGGSSLTGIKLSDIGKPVAKEAEEVAPIEHHETVNVDAEALKLAWANYLQTLENDRPSVFAAIKDIQPQADGDTVILAINQITNDLFAGEREKAADTLKREMGLPSLKMEIKIEKIIDNGPRKAFTDKEKLARMMEKNPHVDELRQKLNLKLDL